MIGAILQAEISAAAKRHNLPPQLISAIVMTESAGDIYAWKVEPQFRHLVDAITGKPFRAITKEERARETAPDDFPRLSHNSRDTEWWGQQASWGPMQVMGALARELGFRLPFPAICTVDAGIELGCLYLARLRDRYHATHGWQGVAAAYNAGSPRRDAGGKYINQEYVDRVTRFRGFVS